MVQATVQEAGKNTLTANDEFKQSNGKWFWIGLIFSVSFHFLIINFSPEMGVDDYRFSAEEIQAIEIPDEIEIPPPPEQISRPARPVISASAEIDEDLTIPPTTFEENPIEDLPPPTETTGEEEEQFRTFVPSMVRPDLQNRSAVSRAIQSLYPPVLRNAGIGGDVVLNVWIDAQGNVVKSAISRSSGYEAMDDAALQVVDRMEFSPALNRDQPVAVIVAIPIQFRVEN